ncbi:Aspartic proteinase nepenthesin-2 [Hibiscus syriacus]|uniref:Aspartic proteinase nepenthesin-2 n=1 Tax=Hibiscus syriacus TaxID=106335 RepID=A0A6A2XF08_HIBSY|nr:Aspartic proteinase nepenthesin-2 [Hibiscus syriacus]
MGSFLWIWFTVDAIDKLLCDFGHREQFDMDSMQALHTIFRSIDPDFLPGEVFDVLQVVLLKRPMLRTTTIDIQRQMRRRQQGRWNFARRGPMGLGRGPLSLVSQLKEPEFSYCLTSIDETQKSLLVMGSIASGTKSLGAMKTTPLIRNPSQPSFYYLSLQGITVGSTALPIKKSTFALQDDGTGGVIIDSGTTITYLEQAASNVLKKEFISQWGFPSTVRAQ